MNETNFRPGTTQTLAIGQGVTSSDPMENNGVARLAADVACDVTLRGPDSTSITSFQFFAGFEYFDLRRGSVISVRWRGFRYGSLDITQSLAAEEIAA